MNRTSTNIISILGADAISKFLGFASIAFLARTLGPEAIGLLAAGMGILTYANIVAEAGLPILGTRKVAEKNPVSISLIKKFFITRLILAIGVFTILVGTLLFTIRDNNLKNLTIIYLLALFPSALVIEWVFQGLKKMTILASGRILAAIIYLLWLLVFVRSESSLLMVPAGWVAGVVAQGIYLWKKLVVSHETTAIKIPNSLDLIKLALPLGAAGLVAQLVTQFPLIYLGIINPHEGGLFSIAFRVIVLMLMIDRVLYTLFFPTITSIIRNNKDNLAIYFSRILKLVAASTIYIGVVAVISSRQLLPFFFGDNFLESTLIFQLLVLYFIFSVVNSVFTFTLIGAEKHGIYLQSLLLGAVGFFGIMLLPGPMPSSHLAAAGLVLFQLISLFVMLKEVQTFIDFSITRLVLMPIIAGIIIMVIFATLYSSFPVLSFIASLVVSPIILYFAAGITPEDKVYALKAIL